MYKCNLALEKKYGRVPKIAILKAFPYVRVYVMYVNVYSSTECRTSPISLWENRGVM